MKPTLQLNARGLLQQVRGHAAAVGLLSGASSLLMLVPTLYLLQVFDRVLVGRSEVTLLALSLMALSLLVLLALAERGRTRALVGLSTRLDAWLSPAAWQAKLSLQQRQPSAEPSRALADVTELRQFLSGPGMLAFLDLPWSLLFAGALFLLHPLLGWTSLAFMALQLGLVVWGHRRSVALAQAHAAEVGQAQARLHTQLRAAESVQAMGLLPALRQRWQHQQQSLRERQAATLAREGALAAGSKWLRYAQQSLSLAVGAWLVIQGELTASAMIAGNVLMARALAPIDALAGGWRGLLGARSAFQRLATLLAEPAPQALDELAAGRAGGVNITLREAVVGVPGGEAAGMASGRAILQGTSLELRAGTVSVLTGASGCGKTTLARVLLGIWPLQAGELLWDGKPMNAQAFSRVGPRVGYVPQDLALFDGTLAENIARMQAVDAEAVIAAARAVGLHETLLRFPKGYDTPIGEAGHLLSAGQRQRLALARAVYGGPGLLVLDEPDAHLDEAGEQALLATLGTLKAQGRTVLIISHRPNILRQADLLLVMQDGRVETRAPAPC